MPELSRFFGIVIRMFAEAGAPHHLPHFFMRHPICRVRSFEIISNYTLRIRFDDGAEQTVDFRPVLEGELYGPLQNLELFKQVRIDAEAHTLVWPNGADFDPATLHDWPIHEKALRKLASRWAAVRA